jgi:CheY-like chemotaxis protein
MRRILLVDDSRNVRRALEASLQPWGFDVQHAENGVKALAQLKATPVDLVFLDINMPVLDGPSLLRIMRSLGIGAPVVLVTSGAATQVIASTVKLGAAEYLSKPFTPQQVREVVARVLKLDLSRMRQFRPRLLLQFAEESFAQALRSLMPEHVVIDAAPLLADAVELAERVRYELVLLDAEIEEAAPLLRERQPTAGIFAVSAGPADPSRLDAASGPLDGLVSRDLDDEVAKEFLYATYLRPLVFMEGGMLRASGFEGDPRHVGAYFRHLARTLLASAEKESTVAPDVAMDLRRAPADAERVPVLVRELCDRLDAVGAAPAFCLTRDQRAMFTGREDESRYVFLELPD